MVEAKDENGDTYFTWEPSGLVDDRISNVFSRTRMHQKYVPTDRTLTPAEEFGWVDRSQVAEDE